MEIVGLDRQQELALLAEMTLTRNLLAYGMQVIHAGTFIDTTLAPILTMLSIGVEKLYKLTFGLIALDRNNRWPTKTEMQKQGHKLVPLHATVMNELRHVPRMGDLCDVHPGTGMTHEQISQGVP